MPASVALNMPSTAAEVTVGSPHWPARGQSRSVLGTAQESPAAAHRCHFGPPRVFPSPGDAAPGPHIPQGYRGTQGCRALTGVGDAEPGCHGQDLPAGVRPGLVAVLLGPAGEDSGAGQHVADQPHQHDGQDDLRGTHRDPPAPLPSPRGGKRGKSGPPQDALSQSLPGTS